MPKQLNKTFPLYFTGNKKNNSPFIHSITHHYFQAKSNIVTRIRVRIEQFLQREIFIQNSVVLIKILIKNGHTFETQQSKNVRGR